MRNVIQSARRYRHRRWIVMAALVAGVAGGFADLVRAERVGTAVVGGKTVVLDSDGTWKYQDGTAASAIGGSSKCDKFKNVSVCLTALGWEKSPTKMGTFEAVYTLNRKIYMGVIAEPNGKKDGMTPELVQRAILSTAGGAGKMTPTDVPVLATSDKVDGLPDTRSISFTIPLNGTPFVYHVAYHIDDERTWQFAFWMVGKELRKDLLADVITALKAIKYE
jgi:hypothetical protein